MSQQQTVTPMMKQFFDLKAKNPDAILLFRCGDFYETYSTDALEASAILGITLTHRSNGRASDGEPMAMAGFPYHALDSYLPKLIRAGKRVAICDQMEDPKLTKKLVKRAITELVTPGITTIDSVLNAKENNYLASVSFQRNIVGFSVLDISTGYFAVAEGTVENIDKLLSSYAPKEILIEYGTKQQFLSHFQGKYNLFEMADWVFKPQFAADKLTEHFGTVSLKGFGLEKMVGATIAAGAILQYLTDTHHNNLQHITTLGTIDQDDYVRLDRFTVRNLELVSGNTEDSVSLLATIDSTISPMGARLLRNHLLFPLKDPEKINRRLDCVQFFYDNSDVADSLRQSLRAIGDLERTISRVALGRISPKEVRYLGESLQSLVPIKELLTGCSQNIIAEYAQRIDLCESIRDRIITVVKPDAPVLIAKGGFINSGVDSELDELRSLSHSTKQYLVELQQHESEITGIPSLKIAYNNVYGYYLEVRNTYKDKVPQEWVRKQTLVDAERYITPELKSFEEKILGAEDRIVDIEQRIFQELVKSLTEWVSVIRQNSQIVALLDLYSSFADIAHSNNYHRPVIDDSLVIDIKEGRHPVIEKQLPAGQEYVSNDVLLDSEKQQILIITGPNMAGKSALLRQTALIALMAQIGSFVPAVSARIGVVDKIFTRVGASDNISLGESTFMVEMTESANILNNLTERSLVLFDELGRGTSTYDGISIAWAIVEYIHQKRNAQARTLFATHYHELNQMAQQFKRIRNYNVSVKEVDDRVLFLRKLQPGGSESSFGINVAKIAGMPRSVIDRAQVILDEMESAGKGMDKPLQELAKTGEGYQLNLFQLDDPVLSQIRDELLNVDVNNLTPLDALNKLNDIKKLLKG